MPELLALLFGANVDPYAADPQEPFRRARAADEGGYNRRGCWTWASPARARPTLSPDRCLGRWRIG